MFLSLINREYVLWSNSQSTTRWKISTDINWKFTIEILQNKYDLDKLIFYKIRVIYWHNYVGLFYKQMYHIDITMQHIFYINNLLYNYNWTHFHIYYKSFKHIFYTYFTYTIYYINIILYTCFVVTMKHIKVTVLIYFTYTRYHKNIIV